ncbi:unnamed protein product [Durusdinium trenchii]|uniref:Uncharacterized protein n=1 Tax=Durusdinium trenchii TaxID=1381693 RepID=A0ABP0IYE6_9DINO
MTGPLSLLCSRSCTSAFAISAGFRDMGTTHHTWRLLCRPSLGPQAAHAWGAVPWGGLTSCQLDLQRWAADHWPAAEKKLEGGWPFLAGAKLMQQPGDRLMMLDTAFAAFARDPCALCSFDPQGRLPLHVAARRSGHAMLVQLLLDLQAEVDAVGQIDGRTALHCACAAGDAQSVRCLLAARADPQRRDHLRMLPLDVAARLRAEEAQEVLLATMVPHSSTCANTGRCHVS